MSLRNTNETNQTQQQSEENTQIKQTPVVIDEETTEKQGINILGYKAKNIGELRKNKAFVSDVSSEFINQPIQEETTEETTHFKLFLQGIMAVKNVGIVLRNLLSHKEKFIKPYLHLFKINIIILCGFHFIMKYIIYPILLHFFANENGEMTGRIPEMHKLIYTIGYYGLLMFAYLKSEDHYKVIAAEYNNILYHNNRTVKTSLTTMYFSVCTTLMLCISFSFGIVYPMIASYFGSFSLIMKFILANIYLFFTTVLYTIYAFNMKLHFRSNWNLSQRVSFFDSRIFFFYGFGFIFTASCLFCHPLLGNAIYAFIFPINVCLAFETHTSDGIGKKRIPLMKGFFNIVNWLNNLLIKNHED